MQNLDTLFINKFKGGRVTCPSCVSPRVSNSLNRLKCNACGRCFSLFIGTPLANYTTDIKRWVLISDFILNNTQSKTVSEFCRENSMARQSFYNAKKKILKYLDFFNELKALLPDIPK